MDAEEGERNQTGFVARRCTNVQQGWWPRRHIVIDWGKRKAVERDDKSMNRMRTRNAYALKVKLCVDVLVHVAVWPLLLYVYRIVLSVRYMSVVGTLTYCEEVVSMCYCSRVFIRNFNCIAYSIYQSCTNHYANKTLVQVIRKKYDVELLRIN